MLQNSAMNVQPGFLSGSMNFRSSLGYQKPNSINPNTFNYQYNNNSFRNSINFNSTYLYNNSILPNPIQPYNIRNQYNFPSIQNNAMMRRIQQMNKILDDSEKNRK